MPFFTIVRWIGKSVCPALLVFALDSAWPATHVFLTEVPDYEWWRGCFGTACGNLIGYWDRHGLPNFYTGPTAGGVAPLNSAGTNEGIRAMWASKAGFDGRPANLPGHEDDYWIDYESPAPDPYVTARRAEHSPDCIGDFIGLNQNRWTDMNGECDGNIDAFSFVYWDDSGARRVNFTPDATAGLPARDIQSGLTAWSEYRGYGCEVFTQLTDFNPIVPTGKGFTFDDLRAEIDAGYPVLLFLQDFQQNSRRIGTMLRANPVIHGMLAYGYYIDNNGSPFVRYRTSWASGDAFQVGETVSPWNSEAWQAELPIRGVIGYRPLPRIVNVSRGNGNLSLAWHGPASKLTNVIQHSVTDLHWYVVEKADNLDPGAFYPISTPTTNHQVTLTNCCEETAFFRIRLVQP
jgi:hypothetical protein